MNKVEKTADTDATAPLEAVAGISQPVSENTHLQQFLFLIILLMLLAGGIQSLTLIDAPGDAGALQSIAFIGMSIAGCLLAYMLTLQDRTRLAALVTITSLVAPILLRAVVSGLGIRSPVIYLMAPGILMAYYILGLRASRAVTAIACLSTVGLYALEVSGRIPGVNQDNLPASTVNLIVTWILVICGLYGANAIRERKDHAIAVAQHQQSLLGKTLDDIALAEASQRQFMQVITGAVSDQARMLYQLAHPGTTSSMPASGLPGAGSHVGEQTARILEVSAVMTESLDRAVEQTERETRLFLNSQDPQDYQTLGVQRTS